MHLSILLLYSNAIHLYTIYKYSRRNDVNYYVFPPFYFNLGNITAFIPNSTVGAENFDNFIIVISNSVCFTHKKIEYTTFQLVILKDVDVEWEKRKEDGSVEREGERERVNKSNIYIIIRYTRVKLSIRAAKAMNTINFCWRYCWMCVETAWCFMHEYVNNTNK